MSNKLIQKYRPEYSSTFWTQQQHHSQLLIPYHFADFVLSDKWSRVWQQSITTTHTPHKRSSTLYFVSKFTFALWAFSTKLEKSMILPFVSGYWNRTPLTSWLEKSKDSLSPTITSRPSPSGPRVLEQMKSLFTCISMQVWIITSTRNRAPQLIPSQKDTLSGMVFDCLVNDIYMFWPPCGLGSVRWELEFEVVGQF